jgi:hypothetical protein
MLASSLLWSVKCGDLGSSSRDSKPEELDILLMELTPKSDSETGLLLELKLKSRLSK